MVIIDKASGLPCLPREILLSWHDATAALELFGNEQRVRTTLAAKPERANRLQLERARKNDEIKGIHRRQVERERSAAAVLVEKIEERRGWSGRAEYSAASNYFPQTSGRGGDSARTRNRTRNRMGAGVDAESPLRLLFGGVEATEARCPADDVMRHQFDQLLACVDTSAREAAASSLLPKQQQHIRLFLESYMQIILRTPPRHFSSSQAYGLWCNGTCSGGQQRFLGSTHSLGVVSSTFHEVMKILYSEAAARAEERGGGSRPALDFAIEDVQLFETFLQSVVLWKWPCLLPAGSVLGQEDETYSQQQQRQRQRRALDALGIDGPRLVNECIDIALLPSIPEVYRLFAAASAGADAELVANIGHLARWRTARLVELFGVHEKYQLDILASSRNEVGASGEEPTLSRAELEATTYGPALAALRSLGNTLSPTLKARAIASTCKEICQCVVRWHGGDVTKGNLASDDFLSVIQVLLVYACVTEPAGSALRQLEAQGTFVETFLPQHLASAEEGYVLALFNTAVGSLQSMASEAARSSADDIDCRSAGSADIAAEAAAVAAAAAVNDGGEGELTKTIGAVVSLVKDSLGLGLQQDEDSC